MKENNGNILHKNTVTYVNSTQILKKNKIHKLFDLKECVPLIKK